jgi:drug/metabolite transporter (DMT)-like permease
VKTIAPAPRSAGLLQALVAVTIWGASFGATKRLLAEVSPETVLFARSVLATLLLVGGLALRGGLRVLPARDMPRVAGLALLGLVATQLLQAHALVRSTSATTAWLVALNPIVTAALAAWLLGEQLAGKAAGLALAFGGTVLVLSRGGSLAAALAMPATRADLLTLVSTVTWAFYTIYGRGILARHRPAVVSAYCVIVAACAFAPAFVAAHGWHELAALSTTGWMCLAYLGIGCSGVGFLLFYAALEHLEASEAAAFIYLEPLVAQVLAVTMLGEPLTGAVVGGGVAILAGVYLVSRAAPPELDTRVVRSTR